jgi:phage-related protein
MPTEKPVEWAGSSRRDLLDFPQEVRRNVGYALGLAQLGSKHPTAKVWHGEGPGVFEVVESAEGNAYRAACTVRFAKVVTCCTAFRKNHQPESRLRKPTLT